MWLLHSHFELIVSKINEIRISQRWPSFYFAGNDENVFIFFNADEFLLRTKF